jgi:arylformamidase
MKLSWEFKGKTVVADVAPDRAVDLSLPVDPVSGLPRAWYKGPATQQPVRNGDWIGSIAEGGAVNFYDQQFNPHAHCTHTETLGHIDGGKQPLSEGYPPAHLLAVLVTLAPDENVLTLEAFWTALSAVIPGKNAIPQAVIVRTHTGPKNDLLKDWSNTSPPYFEPELMRALVKHGVEHLLVDLPSVDPEVDGGELAAHHIFFGVPSAPRKNATITELIAVPPAALDGFYLLNLQVAPWVNDAAPSRPLIFQAHWG